MFRRSVNLLGKVRYPYFTKSPAQTAVTNDVVRYALDLPKAWSDLAVTHHADNLMNHLQEVGPRARKDVIAALMSDHDGQEPLGEPLANQTLDAMHQAKRVMLRPPQPGEQIYEKKQTQKSFFWFVATPDRAWPLRTRAGRPKKYRTAVKTKARLKEKQLAKKAKYAKINARLQRRTDRLAVGGPHMSPITHTASDVTATASA